jgi:2-polyprenyl-3-methyl-5-hydroxy-6-metoxy-1,4-benzoquinol methylase
MFRDTKTPITVTEYQSYVENQIRRAKKTRKQTMKYERRRVWIHERMKQLGVTGQSVLCVGARHGSEVEFFERSGFQADGIDLYAANKIIKCDMSKMLENDYLRNRQYDIVFAHNSLEHCADFDGFLTGLNQICRRYFVCSVPLTCTRRSVWISMVGIATFTNS